jgi:hypothetical protein
LQQVKIMTQTHHLLLDVMYELVVVDALGGDAPYIC